MPLGRGDEGLRHPNEKRILRLCHVKQNPLVSFADHATKVEKEACTIFMFSKEAVVVDCSRSVDALMLSRHAASVK
jgi:hypothetical protein